MKVDELKPRRALELTAKEVGAGKALELGAGKSDDALFLVSKGFQVTSVDVNPQVLSFQRKRAQDLELNVEFLQEDFSRFNFVEEEFDLITSFFALQFLEEKELRETIEKMKLATKAGGVNLLGVLVRDESAEVSPGKTFLEAVDFKEFYSDWKIEAFAEHETPLPRLKSDGTPYKHKAVLLKAVKP